MEEPGANMRFEYEILDDKQIEIKIWGRKDLKDKDGKFIDTFTQKSFLVEPKELIELQHLVTNIVSDWCNKFKCRLDSPECY